MQQGRVIQALPEPGVSEQPTDTSDEKSLVDEISRLSAEGARLTAATAFRLGAMDAYAGIVADRLRELACTRIEGTKDLTTSLTGD